MSAEATGWVWKHSPYKGAELLVHLAIADVVNDVNGNEFWMSGTNLADKAKVSRSTVVATLRDLVDRELMELVESRAHIRQPSRFRFLMPASAVSALVPDNTGATSAHVASAVTALADQLTCAPTARSSAICGPEHARSPRTNPKEITQENKTAFSTGNESDEGPGSAPAWVALGMTFAEWYASGSPEPTLEVVA